MKQATRRYIYGAVSPYPPIPSGVSTMNRLVVLCCFLLFVVAPFLGCDTNDPIADHPPEVPISQGHWDAGSSLTTPRYNHTATLLRDGTVLVVGGRGAFDVAKPSVESIKASYLNRVERYIDGMWRDAASLTTGRQYHTSTLLADGRVLVVGGEYLVALDLGTGVGQFESLASSELFDPIAGTWTPAGSLVQGRYHHRATLLVDGRVLVTGGSTHSVSRLAEAEIYDPISNTWTQVAPLQVARTLHQAVPLRDGGVLVMGGIGQTYEASTERYDSATGTWSLTESMDTGRIEFAAEIMPDGTVLVAGGYRVSDGTVRFLDSVERYDPEASTWSIVGTMMTPRSNHAVVVLPTGEVIVTGGRNGLGFGKPLQEAEYFEPGTQVWRPVSPMEQVRYLHTATLLGNGNILVVGGANAANQPLGETEVYVR